MTAQRLDALSAIIRLRSDRVMLALAERLVTNPSRREPLGRPDRFKSVLLEALEDVAPQQYRLDDLERALRCSCQDMADGNRPDYSYDFLGPVFERHFVFHPRAIERQMAESSHERDMVDHIHPFVIAAHQLAVRLDDRRLSLDQAVDYFQFTHEQMHLPPPGDGTVLADNHVHFNGITPPTMMLSSILRWPSLPDHWRGEQARAGLPLVQEFQCINAGRVSLEQIADIARICHWAVEAAIATGEWDDGTVIRSRVDVARRALMRVLYGSRTVARPWEGRHDWMRRAIARQGSMIARLAAMADRFYRNGEFSAYFLATLTLLHLIFRQRQARWAVLRPFVHILIHCLGILRCYMVMGHGTGLRRFAHFYDSLLRQTDDTAIPAEQGNLERARAIFQAGTHRLNARITPGTLLRMDRMAPLIQGLDRAILECGNPGQRDSRAEILPVALGWEQATASDTPRRGYQFTVHFIRTLGRQVAFDTREDERRRRDSVSRDALALEEFLYRSSHDRLPADRLPQGFYQPAAGSAWRRREHLRGVTLDMTRLVAGLDVAGLEPDLPPEVFAPALVHLRRDDVRRRPLDRRRGSSLASGHRRRLAIHIHAGEDFSCLLTGMRQMDEAITFCELGLGDRIGHGLAIGLPPAQWLARHPTLVLTQGEYFDNMVWAHAMLVRLLPIWQGAGSLLPVYESRVRRLAARLYGEECGDWPPDLWHRLWRYRGLAPEAVRLGLSERPARGGDPLVQTSLRDFRRLAASEQWGLSPVERQRLTRITAVPSRGRRDGVHERRSHMLTVHFRPHHQFNEVDLTGISALEAEAWLAIQDFQIERCSRLGIVIEACPSSNLAIAPIETYAEHPLFRWCPPDEASLAAGGRNNRFNIRTGPIDVCINTDDPGIFNTTLAGEFRHLERTACVAFAISPTAARNWVLKLKHFGKECHAREC